MDLQVNSSKKPKSSVASKLDSFLVKGDFDRPLFVIVMLLLCFGSVMVFSASYAYAYSDKGDSSFYIRKQLVFALIGVLGMWGISKIHYKVIQKLTPVIFLGAGALLVMVLVIGTSEDSAKRWINLGFISFQPSEIAKFALVLMIAWFAHKYRRRIMERDGTMSTYMKSALWGTGIPMLFVLGFCGLVMLENHLSGTIILLCIGLSVIWAGGGKKSVYIFGAAVIVLVVYILMFQPEFLKDHLEPYQWKRIDMWLNPEAYDVQDDTWQTVQGLIAVGSGGIFGRGIGNSLQKHLFISQPQNDFIFAVLCEELGLVGAAALIILYMVFFIRCLQIARRAPDVFSSLTVIGIASHVIIQALLNMMVVTSIIPNTGIALPFFSYGGSSLIFLMAEMGIILSISRFSRIQK
ncbi:MAG: cell division protein FtsW [Clostridia bacterium]|nr:cell division protein FtsW [Clostridia bacterium]